MKAPVPANSYAMLKIKVRSRMPDVKTHVEAISKSFSQALTQEQVALSPDQHRTMLTEIVADVLDEVLRRP